MKFIDVKKAVFWFMLVLCAIIFITGCKTGKQGEETAPAADLQATEPTQEANNTETPTINELDKILFDYDKFNIRADAAEILKKNAEYLKTNPSLMIQIEGHCDERGSIEYNLALGEKRANAAKSYLVNLGVSSKRISVISYGEEKPSDSGHDEAAWSNNRRDEFIVVSKGK